MVPNIELQVSDSVGMPKHCRPMVSAACAAVLLFPQAFAAADSCAVFRLADYRPVAFSRHAFELSPELYHSAGDDENDRTYVHNDPLFSDEEHIRQDNRAYRGSSLSLGAAYEYAGWKEKTEWSIKISTRADGNLRNNPGKLLEQETRYDDQIAAQQRFEREKSAGGDASGNIHAQASYYFAWPFFLAAGISAGGNGRQDESRRTYETFNQILNYDSASYGYFSDISTTRDYSFRSALGPRIGIGHIDDVTYAAAALMILDKTAGTEGRTVSAGTSAIQELAEFLEQRKRRRVYDSRSAVIDDVDTIMAYLSGKGYCPHRRPRTVMEVADLWEYAFHAQRLSGRLIAAHVDFSLDRTVWDTRTDASSCTRIAGSSTSISLDGKNDFNACRDSTTLTHDRQDKLETCIAVPVSGRWEYPVNRYWQVSAFGECAPSYRRLNERLSGGYGAGANRTAKHPAVSAGGGVSAAFYPNTYTSARLAFRGRYERTFDYTDISAAGSTHAFPVPQSTNDMRELRTDLSLRLFWYLSPRLRLNMGTGFNFSDTYEARSTDPWDSGTFIREQTCAKNGHVSAGVDWSVW